MIPSVLDQLPAGLLVAEAPSGRIVLHNGEAERILGHGAISALSTNDYTRYEIFHADGRVFTPEEYPLARALSGNGCRAEAMRFRRWDGRLVWLKVDSAPIHGEGGRIVAAVVTFVDATEHRSSEESLRHRLE